MNVISQLFKALADKTRLRIVFLLCEGELCVCDLTHTLGLPQSTISRHLAHLKNAGLITGRRCKTWTYYRLSEDASPFVRDVLDSLAKHRLEVRQAQKDLAGLEKFRCSSERNCG
jgi:ArsR family transcriptional regulator